MYPIKLKVSNLDVLKIKRAMKKHKGLQIPVCQTDDATNKETVGIWHLTSKQMKKFENIPKNASVKIRFTADQLKKQMEYKGGFIPLLIPIISSLVGAAATAGIDAAVRSGKGIYVSKPTGSFEVQSSGQGLYLAPYPGRHRGYGLFKDGQTIKTKDLNWSKNHKKILHTLL